MFGYLPFFFSQDGSLTGFLLRSYGISLSLNGVEPFKFRTCTHLICDTCLLECFLTFLIRDLALFVGYLLHLFTDTSVDSGTHLLTF